MTDTSPLTTATAAHSTFDPYGQRVEASRVRFLYRMNPHAKLAAPARVVRASEAVTRAVETPSCATAAATDIPITPPPSTTAVAGTRSSVSACSEVITFSPSTSSPGNDRE